MNVCPVCRAERPQTPTPKCPLCGQAYPVRVEIALIPADWPAPFRVGDAHDVRLEDGKAVWTGELPPRTLLRDAVRAALQRFWIAHWEAEWTAVSATGGRLDPSRTLDEVWAHQKRPPAVRLTVSPTAPRKPAPSPVAPSPFPEGPSGRVRTGEALVELGFCDETAIVKALAAQHEDLFRDELFLLPPRPATPDTVGAPPVPPPPSPPRRPLPDTVGAAPAPSKPPPRPATPDTVGAPPVPPPPSPPRRPSPDTVGAAPVPSKPQPRTSPPTGAGRGQRSGAYAPPPASGAYAPPPAAAAAPPMPMPARAGGREMRDESAKMDDRFTEGAVVDLRDVASAPAAAPQPGGHRRRASVRWFRRMNPERIFPLTVVLAKARIRAVRVENVSQAVSEDMLVIPETSPILLVRPVLAGCTCFPPEQKIDVSADTATARFRVLPQLVGVVEDARIELYAGDKLLSQIPLQIEVCRQTAAKVLSAVGLGWPLVDGMMGGPEAKASMLTAAVTGVMQTPGIVEAGLVGLGVAALWSYLRNRPEEAGEDTDVLAVRPLSAAELIADGRKALAERRWTDAIGLFEDAVNVAPNDRDARAGLAAALRHARGPERALDALDAAAAAGVTSAETELIRGACLAVLKRPDEAVAALRRAVQLGLPRQRLSTEPDLAALRYDRGFLELQSRR